MSALPVVLTRTLLAGLVIVAPSLAVAQTATASWDFVTSPHQVLSYDVCVSTRSVACDTVAWSVPATQNWFTFTLTRGVLHLVTVRAVNDAGAGPFAAEIGVSAPLMPPLANRTDAAGTALAFDVPIADPDGSALSFTAAALPPGLAIDTRSGRISGTPTTAGTYRPSVTVSDALGSDTQSFAWVIAATAPPGGGGGASTPMTSVTLSYAPTTPQPVGTSVLLTARGQGGSGTPAYRFWVQPWGGAWQIIQDWSTASAVTWRPAAAGGYNLTVYGRNGTTGNGEVSTSRTFEARAAAGGGGGGGTTSPMTSVALSFSPTTPQAVGTAVVISARGQGGAGTPAYRFLVQPWGGAWQIVQDWSAATSVTWRPAAAGGYNLTVYGRNGPTGPGDVTDSRTFEARASGTGGGGGGGAITPMTSIALSFTPTTPQLVGTSVVITARGQGGTGTPVYRFWVQPWGGAWQIVQDWSPSPTVTWRPAVAGGYNLTVYGRNGTTGEGDVSDSRTFEARR